MGILKFVCGFVSSTLHFCKFTVYKLSKILFYITERKFLYIRKDYGTCSMMLRENIVLLVM